MVKEKIMVIGAGGLIGQSLTPALIEEGYQVAAYTRSGEPLGNISTQSIDLTLTSAIRPVVNYERPDRIIYAAGLVNVTQCEKHPELAHQLNARAVEEIIDAGLAINLGGLILLSTNLVFTGNVGSNFTEYDLPRPTKVYGDTKYKGEQLVNRSNIASQIVRLSTVFGKYRFNNKGLRFIDAVISDLRYKGSFEAMDNVISNPTYLGSVVGGLLFLLNKLDPRDKLTDIIHLVGPDRMSKYDFARQIAIALGFDERKVVRAAKKNYLQGYGSDTSLSPSKLAKMGFRPDNVHTGLIKYKAS